MRIRSIRPEFWSSPDVAALSWETRLIFIGLWSYVDDNGVGRNVDRLIAASLFPLETNTHGVLKRIHGALTELSTRKMVSLYEVAGKPYIHVTAFSTHQVINRASKGRYPLPTCDDAETHDMLSEPSVSTQAVSPLGEGEKGRRGEGEKGGAKRAETPPDHFAEFWSAYPKRTDRGHAVKAWTKATKSTEPAVIIEAAQRFAATINGTDPKFIPHPATWLNGERWADEPPKAETRQTFVEGW